MNAANNTGFLALDVGSSRIKLGWFPPVGDCTSTDKPSQLPIAASKLLQPEAMLAVAHQDHAHLWATLAPWLQEHCHDAPPAYIASVHPETLALVQEMFANRLRVITYTDLPLTIEVDHPERVGIDRLLNAVAVNCLRPAHQPAIIVDFGTANTVDLITTSGAFVGGAILPGISLAASSLHTGTAALPQLAPDEFTDPPPPVGKSTPAAIASGLYWGTLGAVRELITRVGEQCDPPPQVFLTGGGAPQLVEHLQDDEYHVRHIPHLVLSGIARVAEALQ